MLEPKQVSDWECWVVRLSWHAPEVDVSRFETGVFPIVGPEGLRIGRRRDCQLRTTTLIGGRLCATLRPAQDGVELLHAGHVYPIHVEDERATDASHFLVRDGQFIRFFMNDPNHEAAFELTVECRDATKIWPVEFARAESPPTSFSVARAAKLEEPPDSIDDLTLLPTKRYFDAALHTMASHARRRGVSLAVALIDIDHFKAINDHHGREAGDSVLSQFAALLRAAHEISGQVQLVARFSGSQFAIAFRGVDADAATMHVEAIRQWVEKAAFIHDATRLQVTMSAGVSQLEASDPSAVEFLIRADEGRREAKRQGRNRVVRRGA